MDNLPLDLRTLVNQSVTLLGEIIQLELGVNTYNRIERVRSKMAGLRKSSPSETQKTLERTLEEFRVLSSDRERWEIAHSFSLMLELMNACENAYRTFKLRRPEKAPPLGKPQSVIFVLTAHPTEARSPENIEVFHQIQITLTDALSGGFARQQKRLRHLLSLAWRIPIARSRKPSIEDEAEHLYSIVLRQETLSALLGAFETSVPIYIRSWVGGDKDGHPGVDEVATAKSLLSSRKRLVHFARLQFDEVRNSLKLLHNDELLAGLRVSERVLSSLGTLVDGDGGRVRAFRKVIYRFLDEYEMVIKEPHPALLKLKQLIKIFPAMVIPLELRESSEILHPIPYSPGSPNSKPNSKIPQIPVAAPMVAIVRMLKCIERLSRGGDPLWYARGLIVSMTNSFEQIRSAVDLIKIIFGSLKLPVIPLFEQEISLKQSPLILKEMLSARDIKQAVCKTWNKRLEVMLGYSDSAKEIGVISSRIAIAKAMSEIDRLCKSHGVTPLFFHGSGGSVDRGGGSIQEQTAWWPQSALDIPKSTLQGEMVERSFASPEITRGQIEKMILRFNAGVFPRSTASKPMIERFATEARRHYQLKLASPEFMEVIHKATSYRYLNALRMGSRPAKRGKLLTVSSLRAIPWVLCWTQVRILFPTWWGIGSAWKVLKKADRGVLRRAFNDDALFRSFVKSLGFTLAKVELNIWKIYLEQSSLSPELAAKTFREFQLEYQAAVSCVRYISGKTELLWFRPWLGESIALRSPMIHPLNLLQIATMNRSNSGRTSRAARLLIRETATGIASGMMTTG